MPKYEYRLLYSCSSNIAATNRDNAEWHVWHGDDQDEDAESIEAYLSGEDDKQNAMCPGLEELLEEIGFDWWVEVREA